MVANKLSGFHIINGPKMMLNSKILSNYNDQKEHLEGVIFDFWLTGTRQEGPMTRMICTWNPRANEMGGALNKHPIAKVWV